MYHTTGFSRAISAITPLLVQALLDWLGDKGYIGHNMLTPFRKPEGSELLDWQKEFNKQIK